MTTTADDVWRLLAELVKVLKCDLPAKSYKSQNGDRLIKLDRDKNAIIL